MIRIIFLLVLLCLLFGCASTPENTENQNPGTANGNTARAVKTSVDYMREASAAFKRSDYPAAIPLYEKMIAQLEKDLGKRIECGVFGGDMKVELLNDGPVTIWLDTAERQR